MTGTSVIRAYVEAKATLPDGEWLRRSPRETHPAILQAVRDAEAQGMTYDDDVEQEVESVAGDMPAHFHHGHMKRHALTDQLGHEVYIARRLLDDEVAQSALDAALADGYVPFDPVALVDGARYWIRCGTLYVGHSVPIYGEARAVRAVREGSAWAFLPKGARTRGFRPSSPSLVKVRA